LIYDFILTENNINYNNKNNYKVFFVDFLIMYAKPLIIVANQRKTEKTGAKLKLIDLFDLF